MFKPQSIGTGGRNWSVSVITVQDPIDPAGEVIYAKGVCVIFTQPGGAMGPRIPLAVHELDNRASDGKYFIRGKQIYKVGDERACLQDIYSKLVTIGSQSS